MSGAAVAGTGAACGVVMGQVLAEHQVQVAFAEDQDPVQQLAAERPDDALAAGVHPRRPRQDGDDPQSLSLEHLPERGGEERIAIMNQEPQRAAAPAGTITQAFSWPPASEVGAALRSRRRPTPRHNPPVVATAIENAPVR